MNEHPILFSGEMVRAILAGTKTQTRRVIMQGVWGRGKLPTQEFAYAICPAAETGWIAWFGTRNPPETDMPAFTKKAYREGFPCPYGVPDDTLWVRETWSYITLAQNERMPGDKWNPQLNMPVRMLYKADADAQDWQLPGSWTPSIHMPRWASRVTLRVEAVRVERVQDITPASIAAEGLDAGDYGAYASLWDKLNAKRGYGWETNPWVWVIEFSRVEAPQ